MVGGDKRFHCKIFAWKDDATQLSGFPVDIESPSYDCPVLADVNRDGKLELYACTMFGRLYGFDNGGISLPHWPINANNDIGKPTFFRKAPRVADIDGDGEMEIMAGGVTAEWCGDGVIIAYNYDGSLVYGFPIIKSSYNFPAAGEITDLDNDDDLEICTGSEFCLDSTHQAWIYCWDLPYEYNEEKIDWGNYAYDKQHTGKYVNPAIKPPVIRSITPYRLIQRRKNS